MNQREEVMAYLERHGSITQGEAYRLLGIARLAARIHDLRREGVPIVRETVRGINRWGEPVSYAVYHLDSKERAA